MQTRALLAAVVVLFALLGCAPRPLGDGDGSLVYAKKFKPLKCKAGDTCAVKVWVDCPGYQCGIHVDNEFIVVASNAKPQIVWDITAPNDPDHPTDARFRFAPGDRGIVLTDADDPQQFTDCKTVQAKNDRSFTCKDNQRNSDIVIYKYTINIVDADNSLTVPSLDPWIINN